MNEFYKKNGYILVKNLIQKQVIDNIYEEIMNVFEHKDIFDMYKNDFEKYKASANISQYLLSLTQLSCCEEIKKVLIELGLKLLSINTRPLISFSSKFLAKNDMYWKVPSHQDWPSMQGSINSLTLWTSLVDLEPDLGYIEVIPGSHLLGALETDDYQTLKDSDFMNDKFIPIEMNKGDVLIFNTFTIHKSGLNKTNKIRLSTHFRYDDINEESFQKRNFPHYRHDQRLTAGYLFPEFKTKPLIEDLFK